nr:zinc knuckle CX2CX4HX4C [Tanacetum cinerariifolium]
MNDDGSFKDNNCVNGANFNVTSGTDVDSVMAGHDILHVENAWKIPNNSTTNPNKVYGFFLGKRVAYPVVGNYVRNTWGKYRLVKSMLNSSTGLFFFQFSSMDGLDSMLENDTIMVTMPKLVGEWFYTCNIHVEYEWKPPSTSTTPNVEKIGKIERLIIDGKVTLVDDEGKPLEKVYSSNDHDSEDEVESVDKEMASLLASKKVSYGTNSLLEQ